MSRRVAEGTLSVCVVLLMFGTSGVAEDEVIFDLSAAVEELEPEPAVAADIERVVQSGDSAESPQWDLSGDAGVPAEEKLLTPMTPTEAMPGAEQMLMPSQAMTPMPVIYEGFPHWRPPAPHYDMPSRRFSVFPSLTSYGWAYFERCAPTPWTPRGNGIPRRTSCYRMDYRPYTLKHTQSTHGPAYYRRFELYPCEQCHEHRVHLQRYYGAR